MNTNLLDLNNDVLNIICDYVKNDKGNKLPLLSESQFLLVNGNEERNKSVCLFNWLDKKLKITEDRRNCIEKTKLERYVTANYFKIWHYENIDFAKKVLKVYFMFSTKEQDSCHYAYQNVKFRKEE